MERKPIYTATLGEADYTLFRTVIDAGPGRTVRWEWAVKDSLGFRYLYDGPTLTRLWSLYMETL